MWSAYYGSNASKGNVQWRDERRVSAPLELYVIETMRLNIPKHFGLIDPNPIAAASDV